MSDTAKTVATVVETMLAGGATPAQIGTAVQAMVGERRVSTDTGSTSRGTRLTADWAPTEDDIAYALDRGMTRERIAIEAEKFKNHWLSKAGKDATKCDWGRTWSNWILRATEGHHVARNNHNRNNSAAGPAATGANAVVAGMARLAQRRMQNRMSEGASGQLSERADAAPQLDLNGGST